MGQIKFLLFVATCLALLSCGHNKIVVYFNDNTKVDDGEIFGEQLSTFFTPDKHIYVRKIQSNQLQKELNKISDSLSLVEQDQELDDGYYGYAFITSTNDTLYADYNLNYWKSNKKRKALTSEKLKTIVHPVFENPYLKR